MPVTLPFQDKVAIRLSRCGIRIWKIGWPDRFPMVSSEKLAPFWVRYTASAAAIFIGCCVSISRAWMSPVTIVRNVKTSATPAASLAARANTSGCCPLSICQADTPSMKNAPVTKAANTVWENSAQSVEFLSTAQKLVSSALCPAMR